MRKPMLVFSLLSFLSGCALLNSHGPGIGSFRVETIAEPAVASFVVSKTFSLDRANYGYRALMIYDTQATLYALCRNRQTELHPLCSAAETFTVSMGDLQIDRSGSMILELSFRFGDIENKRIRVDQKNQALPIYAEAKARLDAQTLERAEQEAKFRLAYEKALGLFYNSFEM